MGKNRHPARPVGGASMQNKSKGMGMGMSVITDAMLSRIAPAPAAARLPGKKNAQTQGKQTQTQLAARGGRPTDSPAPCPPMWGVLAKGHGVEEAVYRLLLLLGGSGAGTRPARVVVCVTDSGASHGVYLILKLLLKVTYVSEKMTKKQIASNLKLLNQGVSIIITDTDSISSVLGKDIQKIGCVMHAFSPQEAISLSLSQRFASAEHILLGTQVSHLLQCPHRFPAPGRAADLLRADARVAVARKIVSSSTAGVAGTGTPGKQVDAASAASQLVQLRNKLKALMSEYLPLPYWDSTQKILVEGSNSDKDLISSGVSLQEKMSKMTILGMVSVGGGHGAVHGQAESGRVLASSRWMDGVSGEACGAPWGGVRLGASSDGVSKEVGSVINTMKEYCIARIGTAPDTPEKAKKLLPRNVMNTLKLCRVVGFSWSPNPSGDDDQWGGKYGKSCGHNEVVMFFLRPFAPIEVLNTHLCSKASPAPGNSSYEGCLEFLLLQCRWFKRGMHVWDDASFHFIDAKGRHSVQPKKDLLALSTPKLTFIMTQLRWFCIHSPELGDVKKMIILIECYLSIATASLRLRADLPARVSDCIGSFLLCENKKTWKNAIG
jgi:hypothetical protein